eukprot:Anaeramoba_ignava/a609962_9.p1 GENE.a609962_9~~a609962_9.p1  ORF type:complete len:328 (-),score=21.19 a609962_9:816-1799(-)
MYYKKIANLALVGAAAFTFSGCLFLTDQRSNNEVTPTLKYEPAQDNSAPMDFNYPYPNDVSGGTPQLDHHLSTEDKMSPLQKFNYNALKKKKEKNDDLIEDARKDRMDADMKILDILKGINDSTGKTPLSGGMKMTDTYSDPEQAIKHERWRKEQSEIVIEGLKKENNDLDGEMDKIVDEVEKACFPEDTLIVMADGTKKSISEVKVGESVMIYDIGNDLISSSTINKKFVTPNNHLYILNGSIKATAYERFLTLKGWKKIRELTSSDKVFDGNSYVAVKSLTKMEKEMDVYNLNINSTHNFFVARKDKNELFLIHNTSGGSDGGGK